mgnify:CR=1 FL=1
MQEALSLAKLAQEIDEVPVGAIIVKNSKMVLKNLIMVNN